MVVASVEGGYMARRKCNVIRLGDMVKRKEVFYLVRDKRPTVLCILDKDEGD